MANKDALGAQRFECRVLCVNLLIIVSNVVIVLLWQICYYNWCLNFTTDSSISTFYIAIWSVYIAMDLVSLITLCFALHSIRRTLKLSQQKTLNTYMVTSLIIVYMIYISHQIILFVLLGVLQINDAHKRLIIVILTQLAFWLSEIILLLILTILFK